MRIYIAGSISGHDLQERANTFRAAQKRLEALGAEVVNPFECHPNGVTWEEAMRADIHELVTCGAVFLLPGWEKSRGVALELTVARAIGMLILTEVSDGASAGG